MQKYFLILIVFAIFSAQAMAHQDRIIQVAKDGSMTGLPETYLPAKIDLENMAITIARTTFNMPPCVSKYFADYDNLEVTSSWYHTRSTLPPYINFKISPKGKDFEYSLLFGLDDLKPISFGVITHPHEQAIAFHQIEIGDRCTKEISSSYVSK